MPEPARLVASLVLALAGTALAGEASAWTCRNEDLEITCDADRCKSSDGFTSMSVAVDGDGTMEVCAYSGCWQGQINQNVQSNRWIIVASENMRWTGTSPDTGAFALALDRATGVAVLNGEGFAQPMICR